MKTIIYFGDFKRPYDTELYIAKALKELGYEVICKQEDMMLITDIENLMKDIRAVNPILVLFSKGKPMGKSFEFIEQMKKEGFNTACWLFDLYFDLPIDRGAGLRSKIAPFNCETIFSTDGGHDKEFAETGIKKITLRQGIYEPEAILYDRKKTHDIIFVGNDVFKTRVKLLKALEGHYGSQFERFGHVPGKQVRNLPLNELYASTKIVVGDSQPSPKYWSNRIYETLGRGGFLLHPKVEGLDDEFIDGVHYVSYDRDDMNGLIEKIDYYLKHDDEREKIRRAGFEYCKAHYTYKDRCKELMKHYD